MSSLSPALSVRRPSTVQSGAATGCASEGVAASTAAMKARRNIPQASTTSLRPAVHVLRRSEPGVKILQEVEHVEHRPADGALHRFLVWRQVGAFEHDRVDGGMARHQVACGADHLALDLLAVERRGVADEGAGKRA